MKDRKLQPRQVGLPDCESHHVCIRFVFIWAKHCHGSLLTFLSDINEVGRETDPAQPCASENAHGTHTQASKQSKTTVGATNGNKLPQNKARRHKGIIGQEIYVTCIRSSPHHGSRTRGPRDDGFRQGFLFLDLKDFANRRQHLELIRNHVKPAHRRGKSHWSCQMF